GGLTSGTRSVRFSFPRSALGLAGGAVTAGNRRPGAAPAPAGAFWAGAPPPPAAGGGGGGGGAGPGGGGGGGGGAEVAATAARAAGRGLEVPPARRARCAPEGLAQRGLARGRRRAGRRGGRRRGRGRSAGRSGGLGASPKGKRRELGEHSQPHLALGAGRRLDR